MHTTTTARVENQHWYSILAEKRPGCWTFVQYRAEAPLACPQAQPVKIVRAATVPLCKQPHYDRDPLAVFVAKAGGINPAYGHGMRTGEIRRITTLKRLPPGAINRHALLNLEEMAERAHERGYTVEPDIDTFLDALETDTAAHERGDLLGRIYSFDACDWLTGELSKRYEEGYDEDMAA